MGTAHRKHGAYHGHPIHRRGRHPVQLMRSDICLLCDAQGGTITNLCDACVRELPKLPEPCFICGANAIPRARMCAACTIRQPPVDRTICALAYTSPVDHLVGQLKFHRDLRVIPALAGLLLRSTASRTGADWLAPVPIAAPRLRKRGFNQALELARVVSKGTGIRITRVAHRRRGADTPQSSLPDTAARRANVAHAFFARARISGRVAIVDDVVTTGATVNALARCLKRAGASRVEVWAVARTP